MMRLTLSYPWRLLAFSCLSPVGLCATSGSIASSLTSSSPLSSSETNTISSVSQIHSSSASFPASTFSVTSAPLSISLSSASISSSEASTETNQNSFSAFATPSHAPVPGVFLEVDPKHPPSTGSDIVPDFTPAWAAAYKKAKAKVKLTAPLLTSYSP